MTYQVLIPRRDRMDLALPYLQENGCEIIPNSGTTRNDFLHDLRNCDAVLSFETLLDKEAIDAAPKLKIISSFSAGVDTIDVKYAAEKGIMVANSGAANANVVAEHTMYLLLACAKRAKKMEMLAKAGNFTSNQSYYSREVAGSTLGLIGCGRIGRIVAAKAYAGFGMRVIGYDPYLKAEQVPPEIELVQEIDEVLERADFISLHLPLTESTRRCIGAEQLKKMKSDSYLINAARGELICESDLVTALKEGWISGAGLDVFEQEPADPQNPLFALDNVIVTPHSASNVRETWLHMGLNAAKGIVAASRGEKPEFLLNKPAALQGRGSLEA